MQYLDHEPCELIRERNQAIEIVRDELLGLTSTRWVDPPRFIEIIPTVWAMSEHMYESYR